MELAKDFILLIMGMGIAGLIAWGIQTAQVKRNVEDIKLLYNLVDINKTNINSLNSRVCIIEERCGNRNTSCHDQFADMKSRIDKVGKQYDDLLEDIINGIINKMEASYQKAIQDARK